MDITVIGIAFVSAYQVEQVDLPKTRRLVSELHTKYSAHRAGIQAPLVFLNAILYARWDLMA